MSHVDRQASVQGYEEEDTCHMVTDRRLYKDTRRRIHVPCHMLTDRHLYKDEASDLKQP